MTTQTHSSDTRIHRAVSADGTEIAAHVRGRGPALVLVNGGIDDGHTSWGAMLPNLTESFTCYPMSTRGRGLSADNPDHSPERLVEDVAAFADSLGKPVGIVGESSGAALALGAAAKSSAITAVVAYEPAATEALGEDDVSTFTDVVARMEQAAAENRLVEACSIFVQYITNDEELAAVAETSYIEDTARYIPAFLQEVHAQAAPGAVSPTDPATLRLIEAPVLLLRGTKTALPWLAGGVQHVAAHVPQAAVRKVPGVGHAAPAMGTKVLAEEFAAFFASQLQPA